MREKDQESGKKITDIFQSIFAIFKYILYPAKYASLGAYYIVLYIFIMPIRYIINAIQNVIFSFGPSHKKDDNFKMDLNMSEPQEKFSKSSENLNKDIYSQMKINRALAKKKKKTAKIGTKQKERLKNERDELLKSISEGQEKRFTKPQSFRYKALSPDGKVEKGTFLGVSKLDIYTFLTGEGYTVYSITTSEWINFVYGESNVLYKKMSTKDLIFFITQLSTYIKSGITLTEAMRILSRQLQKNRNQHKIMQSIVYYLTMGESFSAALEHQAKVFPNLLINMIKAAEESGNLDETLDDLGNYYTEINSTRKQMISAISYPAFVGGFSIIIITVVMLKIVPKFVSIYASAGAELNPLTAFVINLSTFLQKYILLIIVAIISVVVVVIILYKVVKPFRVFLQTLAMKTPVIGKIIIYNELTIFSKTFASLLKNDVFITDSIEILSKLTNNEIYKEIMMNTVANIASGEKISESFKDHWAVPDVAYYMIVTGENTGELASMMSKVSSFYQEQHATIINSLKSLIEPVMIILLAFVVGGILIAVILPIFYLYSSIDL